MSENETTEMWREYRESRQEKKRVNKISSAQILNDIAYKYGEANGRIIKCVASDVRKLA